MKIEFPALSGQSSHHIDDTSFDIPVHHDAVNAFQKLKSDANKAGFKLHSVSGFRSFERQLKIWNDKCQGKRPLLDAQGDQISHESLSDREKLFAILRWTALPGGSRHHWGTDIDVADATPIEQGYPLQLTVDETTETGIFGAFYGWLDAYLDHQNTFIRPYDGHSCKISPEPWHLSYHPLSTDFAASLDPSLFYPLIKNTKIELKSTILQELETIFHNYIVCHLQS